MTARQLRARAESRLTRIENYQRRFELLSDRRCNAYGSSSVNNRSVQSVGALLHELQVHRIELEMQNEELRQALCALEESRDRYLNLYEFAPIGYVTLSENGIITDINLTATRLLDKDRKHLLKKSFRSLVKAQEQVRWTLHFLRIVKGDGHGQIELCLPRKFGPDLQVVADCMAQSGGVRLTLSDITDRKAVADQLLKLSLAVEQSPNGVVIADKRGRIEYVNQSFVQTTGYTLNEVVGKNPRFLHSGKTSRAVYADMWAHLLEGQAWKGIIMNCRKDGTEYTQSMWISPVRQPNGVVSHYLAITEDITAKKEAEDYIQKLAHFDQLTGLPNRNLMIEQFHIALTRAKRRHECMVVMFIDLDHFKDVNDTLGHSIGDQLLIRQADRIKAALREEDIVSRQGGDEFIVVLPDTTADGAAEVATKLIEDLAQPIKVDSGELVTTASIGMAIYPDDGDDLEGLLKNSDAAMYRAKYSGRNTFCFYTPAMQASSIRALTISHALRYSVVRNELSLHYQPQFSVGARQIVGVEALLRWHHSELGVVSPAEFIPIAEHSGQILTIGEWVLRTAIAQLSAWIAEGIRPVVMSVNLSAAQFRHPNLVELVTSILDENALPHSLLELELTEAVTMDDPEIAIGIMQQLHDEGIHLSLDDFGTGYSSLSYLKQFKVRRLKIDQSFVRDLTHSHEDKSIITAVIQMAKSLGMKTIAEGVEAIEQLDFLRVQGCDEVQGYYYSRPLPAKEAKKFLRQHQKGYDEGGG